MTNVFTLLRLLPVGDRDKEVGILALHHQIIVLERQLGKARPRFSAADRAFLAALLHRFPRDVLGRFRLLVRPETVLRWHRDLLARRHAARFRPRRPGRPRTVRSIRLLVLRLARENPCWGYRRIHGELLVLGNKVAASTVWEILQQAGIDPAPERTTATWASFPGCPDREGCFNVIETPSPVLSTNGSYPGPLTGSSFIMAVVLTPDGPNTRTILTYSESANPRSPHLQRPDPPVLPQAMGHRTIHPDPDPHRPHSAHPAPAQLTCPALAGCQRVARPRYSVLRSRCCN